MGLLPLPNPFGIFRISEIIFVAGFLQPSLLAGSFAGLLTLGFGAEALPPPVPVVRKKKFFAVQAITAARLRLHWFQNRRNQSGKNPSNCRRKSRREEESKHRRRKKNFQRILRRKISRRRSISKTPLLTDFFFARVRLNPPISKIRKSIIENKTFKMNGMNY